jgi:hypothetical protein
MGAPGLDFQTWETDTAGEPLSLYPYPHDSGAEEFEAPRVVE